MDDATPSKGFLFPTVARIRQDLNRDRVVNAWVRESDEYAKIVEGEPTQVVSCLRALKRQKSAAFYVYEQELIGKSATIGDEMVELSKLNARKLSEMTQKPHSTMPHMTTSRNANLAPRSKTNMRRSQNEHNVLRRGWNRSCICSREEQYRADYK